MSESSPDRHSRTGPWLRKRVENLPFHPDSVTAARVRADVQVAREKRAEVEKQNRESRR